MALDNHNGLKRWVRFIVGGAFNTGFTYGLYYLLQNFFLYQIAYAMAYVSGVLFSYYFNARLVFGAKLSWAGLLTYPIVYFVQYGVSAVSLGIIVRRFDVSPQIAPLFVLVISVPLTFYLSKWVLNRRRNLDGDLKID